MATLQDVLKENKELQKKQNTTTVAPIGNPASPYNKAVQTGNPNVQAGRQKISVTPTAQKQTYTTPLQAQTAGSKKEVDLLGNAIGTGTSQTVQMGSSLLKGIPKVAETGARITNNLFGNAPVSPMQTKLNPSDIKTEEKEGNLVQRLANALLGEEKETATVELPKTEQDITKNRFQNIANNEMIAKGEQPVRQITEWSDPWSDALSQNVENVQNFGQTYNQAVRPVTDTLDKAVEGINNYTNTNFAQNLNPTEQFVTQAIGGALPNLARNQLIGALSGGSAPVLRVLSDAAMFIPSFYEGLVDGQAKGLSAEEAMLNAIVRGSIETGTEQMFDFWKMTGGGMGLDEFLIDQIAMSNASPFLKSFIKNATSTLLESSEDVASSFLNSLADTGFYGQELNLKDMTTGMLQEGAASAMSTFVMGLLTGEFSSNSFRNFQAYSDYLKNKTNDKLDIYDDSQKFKTETALLYASMNDEEKAQLLAQTQQEMAKRFGADDDIARMDLQELKDYADRAAEKQIMGLTEEQYAAYIDDMNGTSEPVATVTVKGQPYDVYEYLGVRTPDQDRAMDIAERLGVKAYIVEDLPGGQNAQKMGDGTILISAKAKRPAKALIFHEIFHKLRSDGTWNELLDLAFTNMTKEVGYERYVEDMVAKYVPYYGSVDDNYLKGVALSKESTEKKKTKIHDYLVKQGVDQYYADPNFHNMIDEEIAAEFLERFNNEDTIKAMYNRSGNVFERMWQDLKDSVQNFTGVLTKEEQELKKAERLFAKVANEQKAENELSRDIAYSLKSMGIDLELKTDSEMIQEMISTGVFKDDENSTALDKAKAFVENVDRLMKLLEQKEFLDMHEEADRDTRAFSPYKKNSDKLYEISLDYSTLCKKRIITQAIIENLALEQGRAIDAKTQFAITELLRHYQEQESKLQVACALCYVEAARLKSPKVINQFIDHPEKYLTSYFVQKSGSDGKAIIANAQAEFKQLLGLDPKVTKKVMAEQTAEKMTVGQFNEILRQLGAEETTGNPDENVSTQKVKNAYNSYIANLRQNLTDSLTDEEKATIELAKSLDPKYYLTAQGLTDLKQGKINGQYNPLAQDIYNAFTKRVSSATRSKAIETDVAYYWGDARQVPQSLIKKMNAENGLRTQSWSDFQMHHLLDEISSTAELATRGAKVHAYTKVPEYVLVNGRTGKMINNSLIPAGQTGFDAYGNLIFSPTEGMPIKDSNRLRRLFPDTDGSISIGINDDHIRALLRDERIDYVIPYHVSGLTAHLRTIAGINKWANYTGTQNEVAFRDDPGEAIKFSDWFTDDIKNQNKSGLEIMKDAQQKYLDLCAERGYIPKFPQFLINNGDGSYSISPDAENYWKLLIDRKMINQITGNIIEQKPVRPDYNWEDTEVDGIRVPGLFSLVEEAEDPRTSEIVERMTDVVKKAIEDGTVGAIERNSPDVQQVMDYFLEANPIEKLGEDEDDDLDAEWNGDPYDPDTAVSEQAAAAYSLSDGQEEYFLNSQARDENGNLIEMYHGSPNKGITEFDPSRAGEHTGAYGDRATWFTPNRDFAEEFAYQFLPGSSNLTYTRGEPGEVYPAYLNITNPLDFNNLTDEQRDLFRDELARYGTTDREAQDEFIDALLGYGNHQYLKMFLDYDRARNEGYDGIIDRLYAIGQNRGDDLEYGIFNANQAKSPDNLNPTNNPDIRYSLDAVEPIQPTSNAWRRDHTTDEVKAMYPDLWDVSAEESETRNPTQVKSTISSYRKVYDFLQKNGFNGTILDASSGLGYGTELGRNEYGYDVDDIEPYPGKGYSPRYTDYSSLNKTYDAIISNAVLNVLPQDQRDALVVKMGQMLNPGGQMFVNVRGDDVMNASSKKIINPDNMEVYISNTGSYQKGFKPSELKSYLEDALGEGYTVQPTKMFGKVAAIVTKDPEARYSLDDGTLESAVYIKDGVRGDGSTVSFVDDILDRRKLGETRKKRNLPTGWQGLTRGGKGAVVEGRAFFGEPKEITKESPEYASAMIEGTEYDIPDGGSKWYYPILDVEDFRDNPKPVLRNSPGRAKYSVDEIPEQANRYKAKDNPQGRAANIFLGKLSRERNAADPYTYESISPESFPVPDRIQDYIDLINDEEDRKYGFDAPIENELTDEDKDFYQGLSANRTGALQGFATPTQTFNAIAKGEQREELRDRFERPMYETKKEYNANREQRWNALENMIKETGIQANTPESAAVQWYGEGVKPNEQGETIPYTLDDLKREFPNKWQDIQKMERFMREMYDEYVGRINAALEQVYPNLEEKAQAQLQSWRNKKQIYQDEISMSRNPSANDYWQNEINKLDRKIAKLEGDLESGEYFRNKRLNPRKDYFHHFQEVETSGLGGLKNILQASTLIDPELVGKTEFTKPKSRWMSWLQKRGEGAYTADAVLGMGKYIDSAEYAIAFDPLIAQYRDEISKMVRATRETKNANQLIQYLSAYTNQLAGKTASLDRTILDLLGEGNRGQLFNVLAAINNRAKSNAVVGNVRSAVAQIFNIPNALGIIKSNNAWLKGANDYIQAKLGNRELLNQSPFLQERYFSHNVDDLKARNTNWEKIIGKAGDITNKMMEFGDREATELIWLAAYNEGLEKNVSDPVYYADDLTRRSVAGRGIGEVPYNMKSKVASFFMPFQTETNNAWQELKQNLRDKDANGIFRLMLGSYILNGFAKLLFNDGVVPDVLGALIDGIKKLFDKDREESVGEVALNTGRRMAGEAVSYIPGTSLWLPAIMSDESAEALFGDSDPTRYGTGTVGLSTITKTLADAVDGGDFDLVTPLLQMGLPYGGRQASRLYNTLQDFNVLPSNGVMNTPIGGEKNPVAGDYTQAGALKYRLPEEVNSLGDAAEIARAIMFGSNATNAASEYYDTLKPVLSKERVAKLREHPEVNPDTYIDYLNEASTDGKQGITQQEAYDWISSHNLSDEEANALWEMTSSSWKKSYDEYVPKAEEDTEKKETEKPSDTEKQNKKSGNPTTKKEFTAVADSDGNGSLKQAEAYAWLNDQKLSDAEKAALWELMGWKTDYATYASKH